MTLRETTQVGEITDPATWGGVLPEPTDDIRIAHNNCTLADGNSFTCFDFRPVSAGTQTLLVYGNLQVNGMIDPDGQGRGVNISVEPGGIVYSVGGVRSSNSQGNPVLLNNGGHVNLTGILQATGNAQAARAFRMIGGTADLDVDYVVTTNNGSSIGIIFDGGLANVTTRPHNPTAQAVGLASNRSGPAAYFMVVSGGIVNLHASDVVIRSGAVLVEQTGGEVNVLSLGFEAGTELDGPVFTTYGNSGRNTSEIRAEINIKNQAIDIPEGELFHGRIAGWATLDISGLEVNNRGNFVLSVNTQNAGQGGSSRSQLITDANTVIRNLRRGKSMVTGLGNLPPIRTENSTVFTGIGERRRLGT